MFVMLLLAMLTFMGVVVETIRINIAKSRVSAIGDSALYSASDSDVAYSDARQIVKSNLSHTDKNGLNNGQILLQQGEQGSTLTLTNKLDNSVNLQSFEDPQPNLVVSYQAQTTQVLTTLEIAFSIDVSGSMAGPYLDQTIKGLHDFSDIIFEHERRNDAKTISIVPATGYVNIGNFPHFFDQKSTRIPRSIRKLAREQRWSSLLNQEIPGRDRDAFCARLDENIDGINSPRDITANWIRSLEAAPSRLKKLKLQYSVKQPVKKEYSQGTPLKEYIPTGNRNPYLDGRRDNQGIFDDVDCGISQIQLMDNTYQQFKNSINNLYDEHNTNNAEGVLWAWRVLSPKWKGLWDSRQPDQPRAYDLKDNKKIMVLFSDGKHLIQTEIRDRKQLLLCREMKRQGIIIYSINFESRSDIVRSCASEGKYYRASTRNIRSVMKSIALAINEIRLD